MLQNGFCFKIEPDITTFMLQSLAVSGVSLILLNRCDTVLCRTGTESTVRAAQTHQRRGSRSHGDSVGSHPCGR